MDTIDIQKRLAQLTIEERRLWRELRDAEKQAEPFVTNVDLARGKWAEANRKVSALLDLQNQS